MMLTPHSHDPALATAPSALPENSARQLAGSYSLRVILFLLAHIPLALAMETAWPVATAHALLVTLLGVRWALLGRSRQVIYTLSYIAGAEVLWRMAEARVFWEYGKYALSLVVVAALIGEWRRAGGRLRAMEPLVLLFALAPAVVMTVLDMSPAAAFDQISFNLSAYAALVLAALYLWARPVDREAAGNLLLAMLGPISGVLFLASYSTITQLNIDSFVGASSWIRSGDFGANQVANVLSLGALAGLALLVLLPRARAARFLIGLLTVGMVVQGILTFSRGGTYSLILAGLAFGLHLWRTPGARGRFLALMAAFAVLVFGVVYPRLDDVSTGALTARFQDLDTTGRLELVEADMMSFRENLALGSGVGGSLPYHEYVLGESIGPHTEYTRLLAEHGLFGILIMGLMVWMLLKRYVGNHHGLGRALSAALAVWSLSIMAHSATRIAATSLAFALALVEWQLDDEPVKSHVSPHTMRHLP